MNYKLLKLKEVMSQYGLGEKTIERAVREGDLPIYKLNGTTYYYKSCDIEKWIEGKRVKVCTEPVRFNAYEHLQDLKAKGLIRNA